MGSKAEYRSAIRSRKLIKTAFMELAAEKEISKITVKDIADRADINRGTFYCHYTDIYDLLHQMEEEMLEDFNKALEPLLSAGGESFHPVDISTEIFQCLKDNSDICAVTLGPYGDKEFLAKLINLGRDRCFGSYAQYFKDATPKQIAYFYAFVSSGCMGLLQQWLDDGMTTPAGEIAQMAENIMLHGMDFLQKGLGL